MSNLNEPTITITKREYEKLQEDSQLLDALKGAGVDNWEGYDFALEYLTDSNE